MIIRLRYREWIEEDMCAASGPVHYRIVQVPEGTDAKTLCSRFDDQISVSEFAFDPVGKDPELSDGYCIKGTVRQLEHKKTYSIFFTHRRFNKAIMEKIRRMNDGDKIIK